jgi:hypothetical protein
MIDSLSAVTAGLREDSVESIVAELVGLALSPGRVLTLISSDRRYSLEGNGLHFRVCRGQILLRQSFPPVRQAKIADFELVWEEVSMVWDT